MKVVFYSVSIKILKVAILIKNILSFIFNIPAWIFYHMHIFLSIGMGALIYIVGGMDSEGNIEWNPIVGIGRIMRRISSMDKPWLAIVWVIVFVVFIKAFDLYVSRAFGDMFTFSIFASSISKDRCRIEKLKESIIEIDKKEMTVFNTIDEFTKSSNYDSNK